MPGSNSNENGVTMLCYKGMTFCKSDCTNTKCERNLTPDVVTSAEWWWGGVSPPIAIADFSGKCPEYIPVEVNDG